MAGKNNHYNTERERMRKLALARLLDVHDEAIREIDQRVASEAPENQAVAREAQRDRTVSALLELLYQPEYSVRDAMRASIRELMQFADDVLVVNAEAESLGRTIELEAPEAVLAEWDGEDFGNLVTKLSKVRRALMLGSAIVGPVLGVRIAEHEADRLFGVKPIREHKPAGNSTTSVNVEVPRSRPAPRSQKNSGDTSDE